LTGWGKLKSMKIVENQPLNSFTTFAIGGPARYFAEAQTEAEIVEAVAWAREQKLPFFVLGGGSNLLVADAGFDGLVLRVLVPGFEHVACEDGMTHFVVGAGVSWDDAVRGFVKANCAGAECLAGIPGTVGGTPVQNVGAYGREVGELIVRVRAYDTVDAVWREFAAAECEFAYRHSRFNAQDLGRYIVSKVEYRLQAGGAAEIRYAELRRTLEAEGGALTLRHVAETVCRLRQSKGMLMVEGDPNCCSAGSFFKNPFVSPETIAVIAKVAGKEPPSFAAPEAPGRMKVPAAWLIEQAGFTKGYRKGNAAVSAKHTLALVNCGGATAAEVMALAEEIGAGVEARFGIRLQMEPVRLGF